MYLKCLKIAIKSLIKSVNILRESKMNFSKRDHFFSFWVLTRSKKLSSWKTRMRIIRRCLWIIFKNSIIRFRILKKFLKRKEILFNMILKSSISLKINWINKLIKLKMRLKIKRLKFMKRTIKFAKVKIILKLIKVYKEKIETKFLSTKRSWMEDSFLPKYSREMRLKIW